MEQIIIQDKGVGKRIDKFLKEEFFLYSRGEIIRRIKEGEVKVNNKIPKPSQILEAGDEISVENLSKEPEDKSLKANGGIELDILFKNEDIIVINKQSGVQVHPSFNEKNNTIVNALVAKYPEIKSVHDESENGQLRPGIVHRLDKDTSGVMVIARSQEVFGELKKAFGERKIEKKYLAIVSGELKEKEGVIDKPIARSASYRKQVIARNNTKTIVREAQTQYKVLQEFNNYSLLEVFPKTGRMHQIRIHLASIGHPVVGDLIYGTQEKVEIVPSKAKRQLLHAQKIMFELFEKKYSFEAPMPPDFVDFIAKNTDSE